MRMYILVFFELVVVETLDKKGRVQGGFCFVVEGEVESLICAPFLWLI